MRSLFTLNFRACFESLATVLVLTAAGVISGCLRPPQSTDAATTQSGATSSSEGSTGTAQCIAGASCPQAGSHCRSSAGILCSCVGPAGGAYITCDTTDSRITKGNPAAGAPSDPSMPITSGISSNPLGQRCTDSPPWRTSGDSVYQIRVDAAQRGPAWSRFYERVVAADHANTVLNTAWGRNIQGALRKGHDLAGFQYVRFHGILDSDIGVYSEVNDKPAYNWSRFDAVYDAIIAAKMRPFVEIGFTPPPLASNSAKKLHWYNGAPANISPPKDWQRWMDFMATLVHHVEQRYGVEEVRKRWYFEIWNESSWMYSRGMAGYNELYDYTVQGLTRGDSEIKVGGPAESSGGSIEGITSLIAYCRKNNRKLDFVTYHTYGQTNDSTFALAVPTQIFHESMISTVNKLDFKGELIATEWGASYAATVVRDNEVSASFIAKTIHLIGTDNGIAPPSGFAYWTISDLYEEFDSGKNLAYREGNYGLFLKGDPRYPESFEVAKPAFNAFRLLHMLGDTRLATTGGRTGDGVNGIATLASENSVLQLLVYNHVDGGKANSEDSTLVSVTFNNLPFSSGKVRVRHYVVDRNHSNSYYIWVQMGKPQQPAQSQWSQLRSAGELCYYETAVTPKGHEWTLTFPQNTYSVGLIVLSKS